MNLDELLDRASLTPNADVDCFPAAVDLSADANRAVAVEAELQAKLVGPIGGMGAPGTGPPVYLGPTINAPNIGEPAVIRVAGICRVIYGDTITAGDLLTLEESTGRVLPFDIATLGHVHGFDLTAHRFTVKVLDFGMQPVTGIAPGDFVTTLERDNAGVLTGASELVTVAETSGGEYCVSFTPVESYCTYRLRVRATPAGMLEPVLTPSEFQFPVTPRMLGPAAIGAFIVGQALIAGVADDVGLMIIRNQIF